MPLCRRQSKRRILVKKAPAILLLSLVAAISVPTQNLEAQSPKPPKPDDPVVTVDQILSQYLRAVGGKAAFEKLKSRVMKGTYVLPTKGYTTTVEVYAKAPDKYAFLFTGKHSTAARGFNGTIGWSRDYSEQGLRVLTGAELIADKRDADFYKETRLRDLYPTMVLKGKAKVDELDAYLIEATPAGGRAEMLYFEVKTGLLIRRDTALYYSRPNVEVYYANYKEVDGVRLPSTIRIVHRDTTFMAIFAFDEIKHNVNIDDAKFEKPLDK